MWETASIPGIIIFGVGSLTLLTLTLHSWRRSQSLLPTAIPLFYTSLSLGCFARTAWFAAVLSPSPSPTPPSLPPWLFLLSLAPQALFNTAGFLIAAILLSVYLQTARRAHKVDIALAPHIAISLAGFLALLAAVSVYLAVHVAHDSYSLPTPDCDSQSLPPPSPPPPTNGWGKPRRNIHCSHNNAPWAHFWHPTPQDGATLLLYIHGGVCVIGALVFPVVTIRLAMLVRSVTSLSRSVMAAPRTKILVVGLGVASMFALRASVLLCVATGSLLQQLPPSEHIEKWSAPAAMAYIVGLECVIPAALFAVVAVRSGRHHVSRLPLLGSATTPASTTRMPRPISVARSHQPHTSTPKPVTVETHAFHKRIP